MKHDGNKLRRQCRNSRAKGKEQKQGEDARTAVFLHQFSDTMRQTCLLLGEWSVEE